MLHLTSKDVTEYKAHHFSADASELGIAPGRFPPVMTTDLGNQRTLMFDRISGDDGNAVHYRQVAGCIEVVIFND